VSRTDVAEILPEWEPFAAAVQARPPATGTWCEAWTVRDVVVHQAGTAEELSRVLTGELSGSPVETRGFEEREAPYHELGDADLWAALRRRIEELADTSGSAHGELGPDRDVAWTGRTMKVRWFAEHMREELVLHRWDLTGDDPISLAALSEPWMTTHSVVAVGRPLLTRGAADLDLTTDERIEGRLRVEGRDDIVVAADPTGTRIDLRAPDGPATIESDAATRCLLLWGRRPGDPTRWRSQVGADTLRRVRTLLAGY
jgi:hypothetical protein